jgi:hypothetical protein
MSALDQTVLEMFNHLVQKHPELARTLEQLAGMAQGPESSDLEHWRARGFAAPSPNFIKRATVLRNGLTNGTWVETGTYKGETTELLAQNASMVYSIEPAPTLYAEARQKFETTSKVEIINAPSETALPELLPKLSGDISFWLDGHNSGGVTFKGPNDTPIVEELQCISQHLGRFEKVVILIDDIRLFNGRIYTYGPYPSRDYLVDWAREHQMTWHIEQDIFVCKNF